MADKRKGKKKKEEFTKEEPEKPAKEEYTIASWLRKNVPTKKTKFLNHNVEYFTAAKAVDALMATHWAQAAKEGEEAFFPSRVDIVEFMDTMLRHKFFHRAKKVPVSEAELKAKQKKKEGKKKVEEKVEEKPKKEDAESSHAEGEKAVLPTEERKREGKKRKVRLDMHLEQIFVDGLDAYVWIYDPIPVYYWFFGALLVLGAIAICLFPLWPPSVRKGVYYLSVAAAGFLIFIIGLAVLRLVVFCAVWAATLGTHHVWLFPNLTEDVGFLASFWPVCQYEYKGGGGKKGSKKDKDSDNEDDNKDDEEIDRPDNKAEDERPGDDEAADAKQPLDQSESESESSQKSATGKDFEMVEKDDVES